MVELEELEGLDTGVQAVGARRKQPSPRSLGTGNGDWSFIMGRSAPGKLGKIRIVLRAYETPEVIHWLEMGISDHSGGRWGVFPTSCAE